MLIKVAVQQRQRLFREGLCRLLQAEYDMDVVGTAGIFADLVADCEARRPDVVVLEADALEWDSGGLARGLRRAIPGLRILGLTTGDLSRADTARTHRDNEQHVFGKLGVQNQAHAVAVRLGLRRPERVIGLALAA